MLRQITGGFVGGLLALSALSWGCSGARCEVEALRVLPKDERQLTLGDLEDVRGRIRACKAGDAGR